VEVGDDQAEASDLVALDAAVVVDTSIAGDRADPRDRVGSTVDRPTRPDGLHEGMRRDLLREGDVATDTSENETVDAWQRQLVPRPEGALVCAQRREGRSLTEHRAATHGRHASHDSIEATSAPWHLSLRRSRGANPSLRCERHYERLVTHQEVAMAESPLSDLIAEVARAREAPSHHTPRLVLSGDVTGEGVLDRIADVVNRLIGSMWLFVGISIGIVVWLFAGNIVGFDKTPWPLLLTLLNLPQLSIMISLQVSANRAQAASDARAMADHATLVALHGLSTKQVDILDGQNKVLDILQRAVVTGPKAT
jgi:hypothetical protein